MGTKSELLLKINEERLKVLAQANGLSVIPKTFGKSELIKYLEGVLSLEQIKTYLELSKKENKQETAAQVQEAPKIEKP